MVFSLFFIIFSLASLVFTREMGAAVVQNTSTTIGSDTRPVNVGVILDMGTLDGERALNCISMALSDFYASHIGRNYTTRLVLHARDSKKSVIGAAAAALDLLNNVEVLAILGLETSMQANFVISLGDNAKVPIISFSATSPSLTSLRSPYFIQATLDDSSQVKAISALIQAFGWREAVPIYVDNEFGEGVIPFLTDALQEVDTRVPYRSAIPPSATDDEIVAELYKLMTMQTRVFIVHMLPSLGSRLFTKANEVGMMGAGYVWIITDGITIFLNSMDPSVFDAMQGVLGVAPHVPNMTRLEDFIIRWKRKFPQDNITNAGLNIIYLWAYDAATALAIAVEKVGATNSNFVRNMNISGNSTDLETFGVSRIGSNLSRVLSNARFEGLSGDFNIVNGQLQSSAFQILNIVGMGPRGIGFWTSENGIQRRLDVTNNGIYSTSSANLKAIIWPGETTSAPKGWEIPTNGKKLRVGVPVKGASVFVNVTIDLSSNTTAVTGYCIDVFDAVVAALPYAVSYEYVPFATPDGHSAGDYNDLVYQVFLGNFDAVAGDVTVVANRSNYVDFTLPYTDSSVSMIVPYKAENNNNAWVFLKPLTWDLWVTSGCFFAFIGFLIWALEHQTNEEFIGTPLNQLGTGCWFSFQTLVFAHKEKVVSHLAWFVVIIWCFVVLILTQSYTASLTSMLTVQQLQPSVTQVNELLNNGEIVGYPLNSFVIGLLLQMNFKEANLKGYDTLEELATAFSSGSIAAAFDETPYLKVFLSQYCSQYTLVGPTYKTDGFSIVFPIGSPLVSDVSRAVLKVTEGDKMVRIESAWFGQDSCTDTGTIVASRSLSMNSFWGLFLVVGVAASFALIVFGAMLLYENRQLLIGFMITKRREPSPPPDSPLPATRDQDLHPETTSNQPNYTGDDNVVQTIEEVSITESHRNLEPTLQMQTQDEEEPMPTIQTDHSSSSN